MSPRLEVPPAVTLGKHAKAGVWHHVAEQLDGGDKFRSVCGITQTRVGELEPEIDARADRFRNVNVCAHCKAGGSTLRPITIDAGQEPEEVAPMAAAAPTTKNAAPKKDAGANGAPVTAAALKSAIAKAEKAIASQPARTEVDLTAAKADKAFKLGKSIAADRYLLKRAEAGKTSADTVASMLARIEKRVAERNAIRKGK